MAWNPEHSVIHARRIAENLLAFFEANQVEALLWAHGSALRPFARIENSTANLNKPVYPALMLEEDNNTVDYAVDNPVGTYSFGLEGMIQHQNPVTAVSEAISYAKALASMIRNCPAATLAANTGAITGSIILQEMRIAFEAIKTNEQQNDFLQQFSINPIFSLTGQV